MLGPNWFKWKLELKLSSGKGNILHKVGTMEFKSPES